MKKGIALALLAALLYAVNAPFSKILLNYMPPTLMAGFLYIGAGIGMIIISCARKIQNKSGNEEKLTKSELPYTVAMIFLMLGLNATTAANASLLNNFEIVATAIIALVIFKEKIGLRLWSGIMFVTLSCVILSLEDITSISFSYGSLLVLLAAVCWGFENNCTRRISSKDPLQIVLLKGIFLGLGSIVIGLCVGERVTDFYSVIAVCGVGFVAYGLSIYFYVYAQRLIGAARTSAYYAVSPFAAAIFSMIIFKEIPSVSYFVSIIFMAIGAWLSSR